MLLQRSISKQEAQEQSTFNKITTFKTPIITVSDELKIGTEGFVKSEEEFYHYEIIKGDYIAVLNKDFLKSVYVETFPGYTYFISHMLKGHSGYGIFCIEDEVFNHITKEDNTYHSVVS